MMWREGTLALGLLLGPHLSAMQNKHFRVFFEADIEVGL